MFYTTQILRVSYCLVAASVAYAAPAVNGSQSVESPSAVSSAPASSVYSFIPVEETVSAASNDPNYQAFPQGTDEIPQAINGDLGATILSEDNIEILQQNPDAIAPPTTDHGSTGNAKWPFALSHNRLYSGGWAREQNEEVLPIATTLASVIMRLEAGGLRELHWHTTAEWAYVLNGSTQITAVNSDGQVFVDTVSAGDLWYFPAGVPHSLQATNENPDGSEFLLVFDDGSFSPESTFGLTDWAAHTPKEVLAKNFQVDISAFDHIPSEDLFIFPAVLPSRDNDGLVGPAGPVPNSFTYKLSQAPTIPLSGGSWKVFDTSVFPLANTIVGAIVTVDPGGIRELHWHPTQPEWSYFITGTARMTLFAGSSNARTFDYQAGDVGYVPPSFGHYIENTGSTTLQFLEIFNTDRVEDISLSQWLALTPPELVKAHFGFDDETLASLNKTKQFVVGPKS